MYIAVLWSYRNIEEIMAKRGVPVTYKPGREGCQKFGRVYAARLREKASSVGREMAP